MRLGALCYLLLALACGASLWWPQPLWAAVVLINLLTLLIYGADKLAAIRAWQRVPESTLLVFGLIGGWPGAICGQQLFRHKTRKQPFKTWFICSVVLNLALILAIGYWRYGG
ncbi:uncharacterized membrane protein YsdA (DUF1294 family) [Gibbsiella quercinecans]|uniref:DNA-binding protein n=1 Tax=Gibbsiella quercinecans TaxID=929813 RepID=A0A250B5D9_9GAMM|nr:DUF1294 domain-containing protein [Gibbsiella quercinecans]ATA21450.1 DNA-binding protein [Gibbsiella quercinecans]RLM07907.1 DNA-binding protein [Gibbsiella quercinecans]TCT84322.1 uncharacterized membrane protein YsdA (DUF1294 family) [Gibbsiella quercinecans]